MSDHKMQGVERPARLTGDARVYLDYVRRFEVVPAMLTAGVFRAALEAGDQVIAVRAFVDTIFDGTTPALKVGDTGDDNAYIDAFSLAAAGAANSLAGATAAKDGKLYAASDQIVMTISGAPTKGKVIVELVLGGHPQSIPSYLVNPDA